ncbi:hypothetical protein ACFW4M_31395 [Streptomyces sp. NPDC058794]|uniref:hypothetical protein n=1 Tax=unclassified Streptomyces TaxID=2593676 RepID=UPI00368612EE
MQSVSRSAAPPVASLGAGDAFREIVADFDPAGADPGDEFPDAPLVACCVRHRVLSALPYWEGCVSCHGWTSGATAA